MGQSFRGAGELEFDPAADVLPRDEAIRMGAELTAMHGSDATSQQLEEAYLKGVEYGMTRRDVRPVVLCKDCIYAPSGTDGGEDQGFALNWPHDEWPEDNPCPWKCEDGWYSHKPRPDFFCANGKREE